MKHSSFSNEPQGIWSPLYNIICTVAGTGILQLAFTLRQSGWIQILILLKCAAMANYTGKIIIKCLYIDSNDEDSAENAEQTLINVPTNRLDGYMAIGERAFGRTGRILVHVFQKLELGGVCCLFLILCGKFFTEGLSSEGQNFVPLNTQQWILVSAGCVCIPVVAFHDMEEISALSLFGVVATVLVVLTIVSYSIYDLATGTDTVGGQIIIDWMKLPITFAGTVVSFGGQPVYPSIEEKATPGMWPKILNVAYGCLLMLYIPTAVLGYATFGEETYSPILCNLPRTGVITIFMKLLIAFHVLCAYPILMNVLCKEAETIILTDEPIKNFSPLWWRSNIIRFILVGTTVAIAYFVPYFSDFMSFIGGVAVAFNTYVLPISFYLKLKKISTQEKIVCVYILVIAFCAGATGGFLSMVELINKFRRNADPLDG